MIKSIFNISFLIIGGVVGAGFLTGKEISEFILHSDFLFSIIILFFLFLSVILLFFISKNIDKNILYNVIEPLILCCDFVMSVCMLSAIQYTFSIIFNIDIPIFSLITIIFTSLVLNNGIDGINKINKYLVPIIIISILFLTTKIDVDKVDCFVNKRIDVYKLFCYVGLNIFTLIPLLVNISKTHSKKVLIYSAIFSSIILTLLIAIIYLLLSSHFVTGSMPILEIISNDNVFHLIYIFVVILGVLTTLFCDYYPFYSFYKGKNKVVYKVVVSILVYIFSLFGFDNIITTIYPIVGIIGFIFIIFIAILTVFSPKVQRQNTSSRITHKV